MSTKHLIVSFATVPVLFSLHLTVSVFNQVHFVNSESLSVALPLPLLLYVGLQLCSESAVTWNCNFLILIVACIIFIRFLTCEGLHCHIICNKDPRKHLRHGTYEWQGSELPWHPFAITVSLMNCVEYVTFYMLDISFYYTRHWIKSIWSNCTLYV